MKVQKRNNTEFLECPQQILINYVHISSRALQLRSAMIIFLSFQEFQIYLVKCFDHFLDQIRLYNITVAKTISFVNKAV